MTKDLEKILQTLSLEDKVSLLAGADQWHTHAIDRVGIPALKVSDGPNGVRGEGRDTQEVTSASFPVGTAMGATWNPDLINRVGRALAEETKAKGTHVLLGPTVNMHRAPLAGRNFECFSEDPYLTSRMAVAYIQGLQEGGVGACVKHYACNDQEFKRFSISSEVRERALREIYLPPFRAAVQEAETWTIMSAYNRINGTYASEHDYLLLEILKGEWAFDGLVISDWYGTYSEEVVGSGLDLEMPGPARWMGKDALEAVRSGKVDEKVIDDKITRLLKTLSRTGAFDQEDIPAEEAVDRPEDRILIRQVGREAVVLLKNENALLPLDKNKKLKIALIGANAKKVSFQGGGSSQVNPHYVISPLEAITEAVGDKGEVHYALGCPVYKEIPPLEEEWLRGEDGTQGVLNVRYFDNPDLDGKAIHQVTTSGSQLAWFGEKAEHFNPNRFSLRMTGGFQVPESGTYTMELACIGKGRLYIDDKLIFDLWEEGEQNEPGEGIKKSQEMNLEEGKIYSLRLEYASLPGPRWRGVRVGCLPPLPEDPVGEAEALAAESDLAIVVAGLTPEWETEGQDRVNMDLPRKQNQLIERVAAANPNTVVILNAGSPLHMPWLDTVPAVLQMWYLGQESGNALADVLLGSADPSGRLPTTFPRRLQDNPAHLNFPGENGRVYYGEGLFIGYRYYDQKGIQPLFPFGHGLSYTTFTYDHVKLNGETFQTGDTLKIQVEITNQGDRSGQEVIQLYLRDPDSSLVRPPKELKAFSKVQLEPGETRTVTLLLEEKDLAFYDDAKNNWVVEPGAFEILIGRSAEDIRLSKTFHWSEP
ncbi:MAG: glycoside hydrolase family 3 C-terminal domain-containing protein [Anaerolineales bacterium]|nr:glycoside hydrolase family 3 C-terminal domain-containing protein [Anaerolineales bacterium]